METGHRTEVSADELTIGWARFLAQFRWDHVCTFTFQVERDASWARDAFRRWVRRVNMQVDDIAYFALVEQGNAGGRWHVHALIVGMARLEAEELERLWLSGKSLVAIYEDGHGAERYLAAKVVAGCDFWIGDVLRRKDANRPVSGPPS